ncbi:unnamed protein product [Symbiodinium natans]|uniref:Uncharacterized protein n=1 Tax=Symbiodinium natans TaxID=878477 RepID=A0A812QTH6_9DINO|nr:unnamed protein product [Symbiodinium natans]
MLANNVAFIKTVEITGEYRNYKMGVQALALKDGELFRIGSDGVLDGEWEAAEIWHQPWHLGDAIFEEALETALSQPGDWARGTALWAMAAAPFAFVRTGLKFHLPRKYSSSGSHAPGSRYRVIPLMWSLRVKKIQVHPICTTLIIRVHQLGLQIKSKFRVIFTTVAPRGPSVSALLEVRFALSVLFGSHSQDSQAGPDPTRQMDAFQSSSSRNYSGTALDCVEFVSEVGGIVPLSTLNKQCRKKLIYNLVASLSVRCLWLRSGLAIDLGLGQKAGGSADAVMSEGRHLQLVIKKVFPWLRKAGLRASFEPRPPVPFTPECPTADEGTDAALPFDGHDVSVLHDRGDSEQEAELWSPPYDDAEPWMCGLFLQMPFFCETPRAGSAHEECAPSKHAAVVVQSPLLAMLISQCLPVQDFLAVRSICSVLSQTRAFRELLKVPVPAEMMQWARYGRYGPMSAEQLEKMFGPRSERARAGYPRFIKYYGLDCKPHRRKLPFRDDSFKSTRECWPPRMRSIQSFFNFECCTIPTTGCDDFIVA